MSFAFTDKEENYIVSLMYEYAQQFQSLPPSGEEETAVGWISVTDELPEGECLVLTKQGGIYHVNAINQDQITKDYRGVDKFSRLIRYITHWMPLPAPPSI